ncbi:MAG: rhomboid family intramembrane serine protease [Candidatus Abyssobacteria bacterium SURF_5]|uniref:Rhomboid family intramembrane serine protease n=1 Tax=Abyssobacteria bacterium (strain SURF_5) TaxID=2093360 RepID=A0A3A4NKG8_ABYX5|nr:MAG: rhomboid family intramembrane serine protease [Candidatus Abyssubacteria bacterium SURF_5]
MILPYKIETEIERFPLFTYLIIIANAAVFGVLLFYPDPVRELIYYDYGFIPERFDSLSLFTCMFIHSGWLHVLGNMYFLWLFGRAVEQRFKTLPCALLYFSSGIAGGLLYAGFTPSYAADIPCVGASGAIAGLLGAYAASFPGDKVDCLYFSFILRYGTKITFPTILFLGWWFILQLINAMWSPPFSGDSAIAFWAHIGGFGFGAIVPLLLSYSASVTSSIRRQKVVAALDEYSDFLGQNKFEEAAKKLKEALKVDPRDPLVLIEFGKTEMRRKRADEGRKWFERAFEAAIRKKDDAKAVSSYLALAATGENRPDNSRRLVIGRRFARLKKYGHALGIMADAFRPSAEPRGLDLLLYEMGDIFAGPLNDYGRAHAAFSLLKELFPHSPRSLDAEYRLRKLRAQGKAVFG